MNETLKYLKSLIPRRKKLKKFEYSFLVTPNGQIFNNLSSSRAGCYYTRPQIIKAENIEHANYKVRVKLGPRAVFRVWEVE